MGRKWGQHFLNSPNTVKKIVGVAELGPKDLLVEIGPGHGVLTFALLEKVQSLHAFEIDPQLSQELIARNLPGLEVHQGDFLESQTFKDLIPPADQKMVVVANLPYYVTAPIMENLLWQNAEKIDRAILMIQDEVAQRVTCPGQRSAGALTYFAGAYFQAEYMFTVSPGCFSPPPQVNSAVVRLKRRPNFELSLDYRQFYERLVSTAFGMRRKQLGTSLKSLHPQAVDLLKKADICPTRRPETLSVEEFWSLARIWTDRERP